MSCSERSPGFDQRDFNFRWPGVWYLLGMGHAPSEQQLSSAHLDADTALAVATTLQALTAPSRLLILSRLREGPLTVTQLTVAVDLGQPAVSQQLRVLRSMGLVTARRDGRNMTYSLYDNHVAELLDAAVYHAEHVRLGTPDDVATHPV